MPLPGKSRSNKLRKIRKHPVPRLRTAVRTQKPASREAKRSSGTNPHPFLLPLSVTRAELLDKGGDSDHRFRQLLFDFSTLGASLEVARSHLASLLGLSSPQYNIAMILASHQNTGGINVSDVARRLHVSTAFITAEAGKLEQMSLLEKRPNPKDGRGILLRLTAKGETLVQRVGPERQMVNDELFCSLSARAFRDLSKTLSALIDDFAYTLSLLKHLQNGPAGSLVPAEAKSRSRKRIED
jgi:DNA-binding MarR family transcriptional regulator